MQFPRFIQIHTLHTYPAALLNRDDAGLAKRLPLGNAVRTRISSQCLKRHWRTADDRFALSNLGVPMAVRSRLFTERLREFMVSNGIANEIAGAIAETMKNAFKKGIDKLIKDAKKAKEPKKAKKSVDNDADEIIDSPDESEGNGKVQAFLLGVPEYELLKTICLEVAQSIEPGNNAPLALLERLKAEQTNFEQIGLNCGLESALFGRMVTSDLFASRDAAVSVAHAFTVHPAQVENDYFTVVDDLLREAGELGSAGIFDTELASGLYYGYVVVDVPQLVENLEGIAAKNCFSPQTPAERRELAGRVIEHLIHLIATISPGAKRGSTAPFDWAKLVLVEAGDWQPRSLAGAFHDALPLADKNDSSTIRQRTVARLSGEIAAMDEAYGAPLARRFLSLDPIEVKGAERTNLNKLAEWAKDVVLAGEC